MRQNEAHQRAKISMMSGGSAVQGYGERIGRGITDGDNPNGPERLANVTPSFEWVRLAQRMPAPIHIDDVPDNVRISAGMTCTVVVAAPAREWVITSLIKSAFARPASPGENR